jgi:hypothetical protein
VVEDVERAVTADGELEMRVTLPVPDRDRRSVDPRVPPQRDFKIVAGAACELATCRERESVGFHGYSLSLMEVRSLCSEVGSTLESLLLKGAPVD